MTLRFQSVKVKKKKDFGAEKKLCNSLKSNFLSVNTNFLPSTNLHALTPLIFINFPTRSDGNLHIFIRLWHDS